MTFYITVSVPDYYVCEINIQGDPILGPEN